MLFTRILSAAVFIPVSITLLVIGGWAYSFAVVLLLMVAGVEYVLMLRRGGYQPYQRTLITMIALLAASQALGLLPLLLGPTLAGFLIVTMVAMLANYGRGDIVPAVNFGLTVGGALYIGWLGAHFIAIRQLPDGVWWALISVLATGFGDVGAYFVGRYRGRHKMAPVVSPGKTWEGFAGGVATSAAVGTFVAALAVGQTRAIQVFDGALIGFVVGMVSPAGDLGMSALKRMVGAKNFSNLIPGHGGILDRIDSLLVGVAISFYLVGLLLG